jgi:serine/threonine protein kinase
MLGKSFNAKLCDFGLVKQISNSKTSRSTDSIRGTKGYVDPAYANTGRACEKNDIYSFGIVMLEVVCCERPSVIQNGDRIMNNLVEKVRACHQRNAILDAADERLRGQSDEQLQRVLIIGLLCVHPDPDQRPHTRKVLEYLTSRDVPLSFLPSY